MQLLLLSNSLAPGQGFLEHAFESVSHTLGNGRRLLFFAYASFDPDHYSEVMEAALGPLGVEVVPAHRQANVVVSSNGRRRSSSAAATPFGCSRDSRTQDSLTPCGTA